MTTLDDYRSALLVTFPEEPDEALLHALDARGPGFVEFVVDHGLGPLWHARTGKSEFWQSRMSAEATYAAQEGALNEVTARLDNAGIHHAVIKGAANRLLLYENPAVRACHDIDLLVRWENRVQAAVVLADAGFRPLPEERSISRELVLSKGPVNLDLHWGLLREGRLRSEPAPGMLDRRRRVGDLWMLDADDAFFALIVHPAFAKHLAGWGMGLHRVADIIIWLGTQPADWPSVRDRVARYGAGTAAWATLRWVELLTHPNAPPDVLEYMLAELRPGPLRSAWLSHWLENNLSERTAGVHAARLLGFSLLLHDTVLDAARAVAGRRRARRRESEDLMAFRELLGQ
jgi:hypothetical protein